MLEEHYTILHLEEDDNWLLHSKQHFSKITRNLGHAIKVFQICKKEQPLIFYSHLPSSSFGILKIIFITYAVKWSCSAKIVLHLHRGDFSTNFNRSGLFKELTKIVERNLDYLFALSNCHKKSLQNIFPLKKLKVIENTIEQECNLELRNTSKMSFLYISNYIQEKGILDLLEVFSSLTNRFQNIELYTYGNTFDSDLALKVKNYHNGQSIFIGGKIEGKAKFQAIAKANCFILPSWNEGQPLTLLEAMSQSTPIIASKVGFIPEILGDNYPYLFKARDKNELESVILRFIEDNDIKWATYLKERYQTHFSRRVHREKLMQVFDSLK